MRKFKTKPFDLEEALKGTPVVTRDWQRAEIVGYNPQWIFGVMFKLKGHSCILSANIKGDYWISSLSNYDLFLLDQETQKGGEK